MAQMVSVKLKAGALQRMTLFHSKKHMHECATFWSCNWDIAHSARNLESILMPDALLNLLTLRNPMKEVENFTIFIKNSIRFPLFNVTR